MNCWLIFFFDRIIEIYKISELCKYFEINCEKNLNILIFHQKIDFYRSKNIFWIRHTVYTFDPYILTYGSCQFMVLNVSASSKMILNFFFNFFRFFSKFWSCLNDVEATYSIWLLIGTSFASLTRNYLNFSFFH